VTVTIRQLAKTAALTTVLIVSIGPALYIQRTFNPGIRRSAIRGVFSDLYPRWVGTRAALEGRNPYSQDVTAEIQTGMYGRPLRANERADEQRFAYPAHVIPLMAPFAKLPFSVVGALFAVLVALAIAGSVPLFAYALNLNLRRSQLILAMFIASASWPAVLAIRMQQITGVVVFFLAAASAAMASRRFVLSGLLLALATIKPQLCLLVIVVLTAHVLARWRERWPAVVSFAATTLALTATAERIVPGWFTAWLESLPAYLSYTESRLPLEYLFGNKGRPITFALTILVVVAVYGSVRRRGWHAVMPTALAPACALTLLLLPTQASASYNHLLIIPMALVATAQRRRLTSALTAVVTDLSFVALAWGTLACFFVVIARPPFQYASELPLLNFFLLPVVCTIAAALLSWKGMSAAGFHHAAALSAPSAGVRQIVHESCVRPANLAAEVSGAQWNVRR
jgi:hypothetical protein